MTIWSDSRLLTRGSFAPCTTMSGALMRVAEFSGDSSLRSFLPSGVPGSPMRRYMILRKDSQYGGIAASNVLRFEGPTIDTAAAYTSGGKATPARVAEAP